MYLWSIVHGILRDGVSNFKSNIFLQTGTQFPLVTRGRSCTERKDPTMIPNNRLLRTILWIEGWGRHLRSNEPSWLARLAVVTVCLVLTTFYAILNQTVVWVRFVAFFFVDAGTSFLGLAILLMGPVGVALGKTEQSGDQESLLNHAHSFDVARGDPALRAHAIAISVAVLASCLSDDIMEAREGSLSPPQLVIFVLSDLVEDVLFGCGFFLLAVSYRVIALRVWHLYHTIQDAAIESPQAIVRIVGETRIAYEAIFQDAELVSSRTGVLGLGIILLASIEMASSLESFFNEEQTGKLALLRLLLVLAIMILQMSLAAANVHYASERLAKALSIQTAASQQTFASYGSMDHEVLARTSQTFGHRVRDYPIRMRVSWFYLTTEWAFGICALVFTLLLAIVGIKLPSGD